MSADTDAQQTRPDPIHGANRLDPLTGLRGIAAYSVLLAHVVVSTYAGVEGSDRGIATRLAYFSDVLVFRTEPIMLIE
jgi:peptidoglycan/LPS O-acetylase OafA/YrhL